MSSNTSKTVGTKHPSAHFSKRLFRVAGVVLLVYLALIILLAGCQRRLIYHPAKVSSTVLRRQADRVGMTPWLDEEGKTIGWRDHLPVSAEQPANRLLVFHGNAGYALHRTYFRDGFAGIKNGQQWEVFLFEYPGYGARPGSPSEERFTAAAQEALQNLWQTNQRPTFLLGESIGSGVACNLAAAYPDRIAGLFLITPFTRLADVASKHYPIFPVRLILRDRYDNAAALENYRGPLALMVAGRDKIVPVDLGRGLYDHYQGPKQLWVQQLATHNTINYAPEAAWWTEVSRFLLNSRPSPATTNQPP